MKVEALNVGWVSGAAAIWRQGEDPEARVRFPVPAYVVETETERILIETGPKLWGSRAGDRAEVVVRERAFVVELLRVLGVALQDRDDLPHVLLLISHRVLLASGASPAYDARHPRSGS